MTTTITTPTPTPTIILANSTKHARAVVKRPVICPSQIKAYSSCIVMSSGNRNRNEYEDLSPGDCESVFAPLKACLKENFGEN
jgi:hypothetical protein